MTSLRSKVVVATGDPISARMAGPAIRAWHMAEVLSRAHDVVLITTVTSDRVHPGFDVRAVGEAELRELDQWCDVLVFQGGLLRDFPFLLDSDTVIVADIYDPFHLENLEQGRGQPIDQRDAIIRHLTGVLNEQLQRADFFLAASERQRDFWIGGLAALGRVNPFTYDEDETLSSLVGVAPFGLPAESPVRKAPALRGVVPGIGPDDKVVIWAGGVYNWFDPLTLVRAVDRLRLRVPTIRLFFMGMQHPNPHIPAMRMADEVRALSTELGLTGSHVFFNDSWVEYDHRADYLLDADIGVSTHLGHVETAYSFRTRILDYLWTGLPIVATGGDAFGALIEGADLGAAVPPGDEAALEGALHHLLSDDAALARCRANVARVAPEFQWEAALLPLVEFCGHPRPAPDREHRRAAALSVTPAQSGAAPPPAARSMSRKLVGRTRRFGGRLLRAARRRVRDSRTSG